MRSHLRSIGLAALSLFGVACAPAAATGDEFAVTEGDEARAADDVFVTVRADRRRCAAPLCGGFNLSRANYATLVCADGHAAASCYVSAVDLAGTELPAAQRDALVASLRSDASAAAVVLQGRLRAGTNGAPEQFAAVAVFRTPDPGASTATLVRAVAREACSFQPCSPSRLTSVNSTRTRTSAALDMTRAGGTPLERDQALVGATSDPGVLIRGALAPARAGEESRAFNVTQYFLRVTPDLVAPVCAAGLAPAIAAVTDRVLFTSESDYPFDFVQYPNLPRGPLTAAGFLALTGQPADTLIETRTLDSLFSWLTTGDPAASLGDRALPARYRAMRALLESGLTDIQVFRTGRIEIRVYVVGRDACGNLVGVATTSIET